MVAEKHEVEFPHDAFHSTRRGQSRATSMRHVRGEDAKQLLRDEPVLLHDDHDDSLESIGQGAPHLA